jgi:hypothetical protein|tara:strand:+ start:615 stop:821 length:207 start_codon:yes stop_codon:yes gene_type:complete
MAGKVKSDVIEGTTALTLNVGTVVIVSTSATTWQVNPVICKMPNIPTSNPSVAGQIWRDGTDLKISTG